LTQKPKPGYKLVKSLFGKYEEIPEEWNCFKMNDICKKISVGIATSTTKYFVDKGIPLLRNQNIKEGYIETDDLLHISEEFAKMNQSKKLQEGDIVCMRTGYPGQSAVVPTEMNGWQTFTTLIVRTNHEILNPFFLSIFLNSFGRKQIISAQAGAAQQNLNVGWLSNILILTPPLPEQQKIASILGTVDDTINKYDEIIVQTKRLKKGLMQKLLTKGIGHTKFKEVPYLFQKEIKIPVNWKFEPTEEASEKLVVGFVGTCDPFYTNENGIPMIRTTNVKEGFLDLSNLKYISKEFHEKNKKSQIKPNDLLVSRHGENGEACLAQGIPEANCLNIVIIRPKKEIFDHQFFEYAFNSEITRKQIRRTTAGGVQGVINTGEIAKVKIVIPPMSEQQKIASILSNVDSQIDERKKFRSKLLRLKQGQMQKLLTGQIRVRLN